MGRFKAGFAVPLSQICPKGRAVPR
jgi:hypothetical protein